MKQQSITISERSHSSFSENIHLFNICIT